MQKIIPSIWLEKEVEKTVELYKNTFSNFQLISENHYPDASPRKAGEVMVVEAEIYGSRINLFNGGDYFKLNPSISLSVWHNDKEEIKKLWKSLSKGKILMDLQKYDFGEFYGWCEDEFGVNWQLMYVQNSDPKLIPSIMFTHHNYAKTAEAMKLYCNIFENSKIEMTSPYGENNLNQKPDALAHAEFVLENQKFIAFDSGFDHQFDLNEAFSFIVNCDGQEEVDKYWNYFTQNGGEESMCGWCKDKFGVSWQIVPKQLMEAMSNPDPAKSSHAMQKMLGMKKIVISELE